MRPPAVLAAALALLLAAPATAALTSLDLRISPAIDEWFWVRNLAVPPAIPPDDRHVRDAVAECARLEAALGGTAAWGLVEGAMVDCSTLAEVRRSCEGFPESYRTSHGDIPLRAATLKFVDALVQVEPVFRRSVWPGHQKRLAAARSSIEETLGPAERGWLEDLVTRLGVERPDSATTVYLVVDAPSPRGFTRVDRARRPVCFVGVADTRGTELAEMPVHELVHALDARQGLTRGALRDLRIRLQAAGIPAGSPEGWEAVHILMFIQSGETIRRVLDHRHHHFGEWFGTYSRSPKSAPLLYEWWDRYLDGAVTRDDALAGFVTAYRKALGR